MKKVVSLVLALAMMLCMFAVAEQATVMTHEEYVAAEMDSSVTVETYVQAHQSWWDGKVTVYCQSEDGAYFLYNMPCESAEAAALLVPGTKIRVTGFKSEWAGEVELTFDAEAGIPYEIIADAEPFIPEAADMTALLGTEDLILHQNEYVLFSGMTIESIGEGAAFLYSWDGSGSREANSDLYFNASVNGQTYQFTVESYLCGNDTEVYAAVEALKVGDVVDMTGFLYWYNGVNPHVTGITVK